MSIKRLKAKWWGWLARRNAKKGDYRSALIYCERIVSVYPGWAYFHSYIGYCQMGLEQNEKAVRGFRSCLADRS